MLANKRTTTTHFTFFMCISRDLAAFHALNCNESPYKYNTTIKTQRNNHVLNNVAGSLDKSRSYLLDARTDSVAIVEYGTCSK